MKHAACAALLCTASLALAQPAKKDWTPPSPPKPPAAPVTKDVLEQAVKDGIGLILGLQENGEQWAYEGVYRVNNEIPVGYRIGGTGIASIALMSAPGFNDDKARKDAVARACAFILKNLPDPLMSYEAYDAGYDVRGWGYTYGLAFLLKLESMKAVPEGKSDEIKKAIDFCLSGIERTQIPGVGGWNYARPPGKDKAAPPSPFMTAPTLQALFAAKAAGYEVNAETVNKGLRYLESSRTPAGAVNYSGAADKRGDPVPGAVGRMLATETTLLLAGRGSVNNVRAAVDAFIVHWAWLDQRRAQNGTHMGPYNIAPYYFYYAHGVAAQAVELLPAGERAEYRRRINDLLFSVRLDDGSWNDRVFKRSAAFGTATAMMAIMAPTLDKPAGWAGKPDPAAP